MTRFTAPLIALLLCGTALTGCASDKPSTLGVPKNTAAAANAATPVSDAPALPTDIESNVRQAQAQRLTGHYDEAIHTLSQLMLVASDDPRVVGEYGKTLTEKGRAQDAVQFLTRATELQPTEWSFYSALGVAYDQVGDQAAARTAYEHALRLKPNDPSVLNNYALSRMLANDPVMARQLIARAQAAGGASDPKIARNIELVNKLAADAPVPVAAAEPKAAPVVAATVPVSAPVPVSSSPLPPAAASARNMPAPQSKAQPAPKVVMQADPLAGPAKTASHEPTPLATHAVAKANVQRHAGYFHQDRRRPGALAVARRVVAHPEHLSEVQRAASGGCHARKHGRQRLSHHDSAARQLQSGFVAAWQRSQQRRFQYPVDRGGSGRRQHPPQPAFVDLISSSHASQAPSMAAKPREQERPRFKRG